LSIGLRRAAFALGYRGGARREGASVAFYGLYVGERRWHEPKGVIDVIARYYLDTNATSIAASTA
jgi:2-hydroxychromene-2-carboxylate isomerase